jgi:hypothetical protein
MGYWYVFDVSAWRGSETHVVIQGEADVGAFLAGQGLSRELILTHVFVDRVATLHIS